MKLEIGDRVKFVPSFEIYKSKKNLCGATGSIYKIYINEIFWKIDNHELSSDCSGGPSNLPEKERNMIWRSEKHQLCLICNYCLSENCPTIRQE